MNKVSGKNPFYVKVFHKEECFYIFTDEYDLSGFIKKEVARVKDLPPETMKLYMGKRLIEDNTTNHDQQIKHNCELHVIFKKGESEWETINEILNYSHIPTKGV